MLAAQHLQVSIADLLRDPVKPHLIHRCKPHNGETQRHASAGKQYHPGKTMVKLGEIPGTDIGNDTYKWQKYDHALEPHGPYPGVAENEADDEKDKCNTEQVDMGNTYQCLNGGSGILGDDSLNIIEAIQIG